MEILRTAANGGATLRKGCWCPGEDSNLHELLHWYLKPARLPVPPPGPRWVRDTRGAEIYATNQGLSIDAPHPIYDPHSLWRYLPMTRRGSSGPPHPPNKHSSNKRSSATAPKDWRGEDPNLELEKARYADPIDRK